ncbi:MAG: hypothetical protein HYX43_10560 [Burkholderiales bacterium]|nr:hypothetical protein [Burkholderiales bacterium]
MIASMEETNASLVKVGLKPIDESNLHDAANAIRKFGNQFKGLLVLAERMEQGASIMQTIDEARDRQTALAKEEAQLGERLAAVRSELGAAESRLVEAKSDAERTAAGARDEAARILSDAEGKAAEILKAANADKSAAAADRAKAAQILAQVG